MWGSTAAPNGGYIPDPLAQFLSRVVPWSTTQPPDGFVSIHAFGGTGSFTYKGGGRAYGSLNDYGTLKSHVEYLNRTECEVFFCLSLQGRVTPDQRGRLKVSRRAENVVRARSFVLDLDVKAKRYSSQRAALAALLPFCADLGLELGPIVDSGYGIHAYIVVDQPLTIQDWRPLAQQLKAAGEAKGLLFDTGVTVNPATLLRLPTSTNRKPDNPDGPKLCRVLQMGGVMVLDDLRAALSEFPVGPIVTSGVSSGILLDPAIFPRRPPITGAYADHVRQQLDAGRIVTNTELLYNACPVVADSYERGGNGDPEPLWHNFAKLCHYVEDGRNFFHDLSSDDPRYDEADTDAKFDIAHTGGWPQCATIASACVEANALCQRCSFYGKGGSPLNYATRGLIGAPGAAPPTVPYVNGTPTPVTNVAAFGSAIAVPSIQLPSNYTFTVDNRIASIDEQVAVFNEEIVTINLVSAPSTAVEGSYEDHIEVKLNRFTSEGGRYTFTFSFGALAREGSLLGEATFRHGLTFNNRKVAWKFFMDWTSTIKAGRKVTGASRMGWTTADDGDVTGFAYGGFTTTPFGQSISRVPKALEDRYMPRGTLAGWQAAVRDLFAQGVIEQQIVIAAAMASPLTKFSTEPGLILYIRSPGSATGKTAALSHAVSTWAAQSAMIKSFTENAAFGVMASLQNLPICIDELINNEKDKRNFIQFVMLATGGSDKFRQNRNAELRPTLQWRSMLIGTGNPSLLDRIASNDTDAPSARITEIEMPSRSNVMLMRSRVAEILDALDANRGQAGLVLGAFYGRYHEQCKKMVRWIGDELMRQLGNHNIDRFWIATAAVILAGASIAKKLGLMPFDVEAMWKYLVRNIHRMRLLVSDLGGNVDDPATHVARFEEFINENNLHLIQTDTIPIQGANRFAVKQTIINGEMVERSQFFIGRIGKQDQKMLISRVQFDVWCKKKNYNSRHSVKVLETAGLLTKLHNKRSLSAQTSMKAMLAAEVVFEFDLSHPDLQGFLQ